MNLPAPESLLDALPHGAALLDREGAIAATNTEFSRLAGNDAPSLRGTSFFDAYGFIPAVQAAREPYLSGRVPVLVEAETQHFGAVPGDRRVRLASFGEGPGRGALVLVEEISAERRARAAAEACDAVLDAISHARHEINNSLMGMIGHLELLLAKPDLADAVRKRAEKIYREAEKIRDRVADLAAARKT